MNPYDVLDIDRSADPEAVKAAYRRAAKDTHPDAPGGSQNRFALVKQCYDVLKDAERRRRYDQTGEMDEKQPDNGLSEALQCIATALEAALADCQSNRRDPETVDLAAWMRRWIDKELLANVQQVEQMQKVIAKNEALGRRFGGETMQQIITGRVSMLRQRIASFEHNRESGKRALAMLQGVTFSADKPQEPKPGDIMAYFASQLG